MKVIWVYLELKIQNVEQQSGAQVFGLCLIGLWGAAALIWVALKERKGKERKGKERKGKERKGKERKGKERKGREAKYGVPYLEFVLCI